ncbi:hypothetical protein [Leptospira inadai]|nr:hypothetical protein [Leptospira inadai]
MERLRYSAVAPSIRYRVFLNIIYLTYIWMESIALILEKFLGLDHFI